MRPSLAFVGVAPGCGPSIVHCLSYVVNLNKRMQTCGRHCFQYSAATSWYLLCLSCAPEVLGSIPAHLLGCSRGKCVGQSRLLWSSQTWSHPTWGLQMRSHPLRGAHCRLGLVADRPVVPVVDVPAAVTSNVGAPNAATFNEGAQGILGLDVDMPFEPVVVVPDAVTSNMGGS